MDEQILVHSPLYLLSATASCWKCASRQAVAALGCHNLSEAGQDLVALGDTSELVLLSYVTRLPAAVLRRVTSRNPRYRLRSSATFEDSYYANSCECGTLLGDHHLYSVPGGAFFPEEVATASAITLELLEIEGPLPFECTYSVGDSGRLILAHARRLEGAVRA